MKDFYISDSHTDLLTSYADKIMKNQSYFQVNDYENIKTKTINFLLQQKLDTIALAVFTYNKNIGMNDLKLFRRIVDFVDERELVSVLFCIEDMGIIKNFYDLECMVKLKPFACTLTWNFDNQFCGGTYGKRGFTKFGKFVVDYLEKNGVIVDTAHMNKKSFWEFVNLTNKPIFNSHSNIFSLHKHKRNLIDKQIEMIVESNGYLGITLYDKFISKKQTNSYDIAKQFNYLAERFGVNNFGFGTDFFGIEESCLPIDVDSYNDLYNVAEHLQTLGYSSLDVQKLMRKNFSDFVFRIKSSM